MENPFKFGSIVEDEFFTDRFELEDPFFGEWLVASISPLAPVFPRFWDVCLLLL